MVIGWKTQREVKEDIAEPKSFDDFELRLGDIMRGERATMGKSLLDVQRDLRIKATYIAAIENCDPDVFETPGFIAGYVRSYARYLNLDADETFAAFCAESGFSTAHGMSDKASSRKAVVPAQGIKSNKGPRDPLMDPRMPFTPANDGFFSSIEPGAIGSSLVLIGLIVGIGYGGWSVLKEVQRVQVSPVEQTPIVLSDLDPLTTVVAEPAADDAIAASGVFTPPRSDMMDRLYRPQALDVPVLVARDAPISTLDPNSVGSFAAAKTPGLPEVDLASAAVAGTSVLDGDKLTLVAARPAWVRVRDANNAVVYEATMQPGDTWTVPAELGTPRLSVGESGALYFAMNGQTYGPAGRSGQSITDLKLDPYVLAAAYRPADVTKDEALSGVLADLRNTDAHAPAQPKVLQDGAQGVMMVAVRPAWVRVRGADGSVIYEGIMNAGDTWIAPATEEPAALRVGESGAIYFAVNGRVFGPAGPSGVVTKNIALGPDTLQQSYQVADITADGDLQRVLANLDASLVSPAAD
ncbi:helix-turn-helix domain-containing protein [Pseudoprimorskyibacter insulae]|uniref:Cytoskeleton protein RodZ n=1 Tax=Pseudoprimorskyibacter insulae TaxID=1695997 RepID=A0A2R8AXN4_9RHOB|nr:helix-turn-helix domain-containing protein [Pseudoprimorskyibacter insulae]SPF80717.1 Cytoskeleton protein RodZ [Pseudoprimorskyibacter insulae]